MSRPHYDTMYCHDPTCSEFNVGHEFWYQPADWDGPAEWIDEPECRICHGACHEGPFDYEHAAENASWELPASGPHSKLGAADRTFIAAIQTYLGAKPPQNGMQP